MKTLATSAAEQNFGELLDMAQSEPVHLQRHGQDVAVVLSPEEFRRLSEAALTRVNPMVQKLHAESAERWAKVYEALAK
jgi:antitoxin Phd